MRRMLYTIGHSTHPIERFLGLLQGHGVTAVADVRSTPQSRFNPQFNRRSLQESLRGAGIEYVFLGEELGARSKDPACYEDGRVSYTRLAATPLFQQGIDRLQAGMSSHTIALMCAEKEPLVCHRTILVARELRRRGVEIAHILESGQLESHEAALARLRGQLAISPSDLFGNEQEADAQAYETQARRIAYVEPGTRRS